MVSVVQESGLKAKQSSERPVEGLIDGFRNSFPVLVKVEAAGLREVSPDLRSIDHQVASDSFKLMYCSQGSPSRSTPANSAGLWPACSAPGR